MIIRAMQLRVVTTEKKDFGCIVKFSRNLNIIYAKNSSGKSTLFNCLIYALGMEELIGGKNEKVLPSAVKEYFEYRGNRIDVIASEVLLEVENSKGEIITLHRVIRDSVKNVKLIEVYHAAHLTKDESLGDATPTYLHDAGSARKNEGFYRFLESFLELNLPKVPGTNGREVPLYLQTIFAALFVEQKRGWTNYIANIPFYGIRNVRVRVVEFLLGLDIFETEVIRSRLDLDSSRIDSDWKRIIKEISQEAESFGLELVGVERAPSVLFKVSGLQLVRKSADGVSSISECVSELKMEYEKLEDEKERFNNASSTDVLEKVKAVSEELQSIMVLYEQATNALMGKRLSLNDYQELLEETSEDLDKNKATRKLRELGAEQGLKTASELCPTCNQNVEDTLLAQVVTGPQMDLDANIKYLHSQYNMLERQITGLQESIQVNETNVITLESEINRKRDILVAMRNDVASGTTESKAIIRRQVQIEIEIENLQKLEQKMTTAARELGELVKEVITNQESRRKLPNDVYSHSDKRRIALFQKNFRNNAKLFEYSSADLDEVEISKDNLTPSLSQMELREIRTDITSNSSASDFIRLIWSYLLALFQTSNSTDLGGNHPRILMFDEPGQHAMAVSSQNQLFKKLASETELQSIVAASFDEDEELFLKATANVDCTLITWEGKLLQPMRIL